MTIAQPSSRWKGLFQPVAFPGWALLGWKFIETIHTLAFVNDHLGWLWKFLESPVGNLAAILLGLAWLALVVFFPRKLPVAPTATLAPRQIWFFSPGISVGLNRSTSTVIVTLQILSTERAELTHVRVELRNTGKGTVSTCENSEPMIINKLSPATKMFEQKISQQEAEGFVHGAVYQLSGYATFRDGDELSKVPIKMITIPSC